MSGPGKDLPMPLQRTTDYAALRRLLQQADADWERLTQSLQADQQALEALQQRHQNLRLLLALEREMPSKACQALTAQGAALACQIALLEQKIIQERARRDALEQQFDQARLALVTLRRMSQRRRSRWASGRKLLIGSMKWFLHELWSGLQTFEYGSEIIPRDQSLGEQHLFPPTP